MLDCGFWVDSPPPARAIVASMAGGNGARLAVHAAIGAEQPRAVQPELGGGDLVFPGHGSGFRRKRRTYKTVQLGRYLQSKGKLPAEVLADLIREGWRKLQRDLKCTPLEAWDRWFGMVCALLPYTAAKLGSLEITGDLGGGGGGPSALHLLAAQAMAGQLAEIRAGFDALGAVGDRGPANGRPNQQSGHQQQTLELGRFQPAIPSQIPDGMPLE